jgi:hypothetical protein
MHVGTPVDPVAHGHAHAVRAHGLELRLGQIAIPAARGLDADQLALAGLHARTLHMCIHDQAASISLVNMPYQ